MKIIVYAIAKDESKNVHDFVSSCSDADKIIVGVEPNDPTSKLLKYEGADVLEFKLPEFRFDSYRNYVLENVDVDSDVCISLDLDERLEVGWRKKIEKVWEKNTTRLNYWLQWSDNRRFFYDRIHSRSGYRWKYANHECLVRQYGEKEVISTSDLTIFHKRDHEKDRTKNLHLLQIAIQEDPQSARMLWYYGRELYYQQQYEKSIDIFNKYLQFGIWAEERSWACIFISRNLIELDRKFDAEAYLHMAIHECNDLRDPYFELANLYFGSNNHERSLLELDRAARIFSKRNMFHESNGAYSEKLYLLRMKVFTLLGNHKEAEISFRKARRINPSILENEDEVCNLRDFEK